MNLFPDGRRAPMMGEAGEGATETLPKLFALLAEGQLRPLVAERIPLAEAARAHETLERGGVAGKLVLVAGE